MQISLVLNVLLENQWPAIHRGASQAEEQLRRLAEKEGGTGTNPQNPFVQIQKLIVQVFWWYFSFQNVGKGVLAVDLLCDY